MKALTNFNFTDIINLTTISNTEMTFGTVSPKRNLTGNYRICLAFCSLPLIVLTFIVTILHVTFTLIHTPFKKLLFF